MVVARLRAGLILPFHGSWGGSAGAALSALEAVCGGKRRRAPIVVPRPCRQWLSENRGGWAFRGSDRLLRSRPSRLNRFNARATPVEAAFSYRHRVSLGTTEVRIR
jgi:hypothetical protein